MSRPQLAVDVALGAAATEADGRSGSEQQLRRMFEDHFDFVWRSIRRFGLSDADDDAAQRVFMVASTKLEMVTAAKERDFLHGIALGVVANARRSLARRREVPDDVLSALTSLKVLQ